MLGARHQEKILEAGVKGSVQSRHVSDEQPSHLGLGPRSGRRVASMMDLVTLMLVLTLTQNLTRLSTALAARLESGCR